MDNIEAQVTHLEENKDEEEDEIYISPEDIEAEVKSQIEEKLKKLTDEKTAFIEQQSHQIRAHRQMRDDIQARKNELEALIESQKPCEDGEEKQFIQEQRSQIADQHEQLELQRQRKCRL